MVIITNIRGSNIVIPDPFHHGQCHRPTWTNHPDQRPNYFRALLWRDYLLAVSYPRNNRGFSRCTTLAGNRCKARCWPPRPHPAVSARTRWIPIAREAWTRPSWVSCQVRRPAEKPRSPTMKIRWTTCRRARWASRRRRSSDSIPVREHPAWSPLWTLWAPLARPEARPRTGLSITIDVTRLPWRGSSDGIRQPPTRAVMIASRVRRSSTITGHWWVTNDPTTCSPNKTTKETARRVGITSSRRSRQNHRCRRTSATMTASTVHFVALSAPWSPQTTICRPTWAVSFTAVMPATVRPPPLLPPPPRMPSAGTICSTGGPTSRASSVCSSTLPSYRTAPVECLDYRQISPSRLRNTFETDPRIWCRDNLVNNSSLVTVRIISRKL